jgi:hypothetical protein
MKTRYGLFFGFAVPVMAAIMMLMGLAACRSSPESHFTVTSRGDECVITKYTGPGGRVIIPAKIQGLPVRVIGLEAFRDCTSLTSVTIPGSVTGIGNLAFRGCTSLTSVTIPGSVTRIGLGAFSNTNLASITIPDSITEIPYGMFSGCTSLKSITIPDSVTRIVEFAFQDCTNLTSVTIPDSVTVINYSAFEGCTSLVSVTIPDSVTEIGFKAFMGCTNLENVTIALVAERKWRSSDQFAGCKLSRTAQQALKDAGYPGNF